MMRRFGILALTAITACGPKVTVMHAQVGDVTMSVEDVTGAWAPSTLRPTLLASGQWVEVGEDVAYVYVDSEAGLSARVDGVGEAGNPSISLRRLTWAPATYRSLSAAEVQERGLEATPEWLANYRPQPPIGTPYGTWRSEPALSHRFHPDFPDDLRVVLVSQLEQGPYYEIVWVGLRACDHSECRGALLNQPTHLPYIVGQQVQMDFDGVAPDRLPLARGLDEPVNERFVQLAATHPGLQGQLQDEAAWVSTDRQTEDALVPVGSWARVGDNVVHFIVYQGYPAAWFPDGRVTPTPWRPDATVLIEDAEREQLGLVAVPTVPEAGPQPEPGLWGRWRIDDGTAWLFDRSAPDRVMVLDAVDGDVIQVDVFSCEAITCAGVVLEPGHAWQGKVVEFPSVRVPDMPGRQFPVAQRR